MKHKHLFKKISDETLMLNENPFDLPEDVIKDIEPTLTRVVKFKCECGAAQEFHDIPDGEWAESLPDEFIIHKPTTKRKK